MFLIDKPEWQSSMFNVDQQQYADDTQVFISLSKGNSPDRASRLETALVHLTSWFYHNGLALNPEKSEAILLGTHPRNKSLDNITQVDVNGSPIPISDSIKLLGVTIDSSLAFNKHVSLICQSCQYHIRALRHIRPILDANTARLVGHALVSSRLDYANSIMYGMSKSLTAKLQRQQNMLEHVGPRRFANESFEQCRTTAQRTSLASSGIEDPFQNSYSHTQNSQHRHTILFVLSTEPLQTNSTASFVQLKSPGTTTLQN